MGTQKTIAAQIYQAQADYILSLKANHRKLFAGVEQWFNTQRAAQNLPPAVEYKIESAHHRTEIRQVWTIPMALLPPLHQAHQWRGLQTIVIVERTVTFGEDACRGRSMHSPHNLALLRRLALNALNQTIDGKRSLRQKSKRAAMDDAYMLKVLAAALPEPNQIPQPICQ